MRNLIVGLLILLLPLAGCVESTGQSTDPSSSHSATASVSASTPAVDAGAIRGGVFDEELKAISGAGVGVIALNLQVETDESGAFAFEGVPPGDYDVVAQKIGYESRAMKVKVEPSQAAYVNFTLVALSIEEGYPLTFMRSEIIECFLAAEVWVSACSYPYTAVYLTAKNNGVNLSQYGAPEDIQDNEVRINWTIAKGARGVVTEMFWTPTTDSAKNMMVYNCRPDYDPVLDACGRTYSSGTGSNPLNYQWEVPKDIIPKEDGAVTWIMSIIWPDFGNTPGVALDQKVDLYQTVFYGIEPPEEWSVLPPSGG